MHPLNELANRLRERFPDARLEVSEPDTPDRVGWLDIAYRGNILEVLWQKDRPFGIASPEGHCYGEGPDETYATVEDTVARITWLLLTGNKTQQPLEVTLREIRAEHNLPQTELAALLGISQPAVSRLERNVSRMMVTSLRAVIQAMGGELVLQARFRDGSVREIAIDDDPMPANGASRDEPLVASK